MGTWHENWKGIILEQLNWLDVHIEYEKLPLSDNMECKALVNRNWNCTTQIIVDFTDKVVALVELLNSNDLSSVIVFMASLTMKMYNQMPKNTRFYEFFVMHELA